MRSYSCIYRSIRGGGVTAGLQRDYSGSLGCGACGDDGGVADGDDVAACGDGVSDIRLSKKQNARGSIAWCMILPLDPQGPLHETPRK